MVDKAVGNVCQYWIKEEPVKCSYWNESYESCSYVGENGAVAPFFPFCNFLGTTIACSKYDGTGTLKRCVLPDPYRHVVNRSDGKKWVDIPPVGKNGLPTENLIFDRITGYNNGQCDGFGTDATCSGYSPYILQFGVKQPDDRDGTLGVDAYALSALSGVRLPLDYEVFNRRAALGKCYFWTGEPLEFTADATTGKVSPINFNCTQFDEIVRQHSEFKFNKALNMYTAPCNGCKPECPHYTCGCWEYCVDSKMRLGDKVLGEQILELRWKIRKESWDIADYYRIFEDPEIYAWLGKTKSVVDSGGDEQIQIPAMRTYIDSFENFEIAYRATTLTEGLNADDYTKRYPTLVKRLKDLPLAPIIRNKFDKIRNVNVFETNGRFEHENILLIGDTFFTDSEVYAINLSDPDLDFLPIELQRYDSMYRIEMSLKDRFKSFYDDFDNKISLMQYLMPEKMHTSELPTANFMFYNPVKTFWGKNVIIVLSKIKGRWEYDSITIYKPYTGGVVGQTAFTIDGDGGEVPYLPSYENDFGAYNNANGSIDFQFFPMSSDSNFGPASAAYAYIDGVKKRLPANPTLLPEYDTYEFTYILYKTLIETDLEVKYSNMRFFGNAGYGFIFLPDYARDLSTVVKPWEIDGKIYLVYPDGKRVEMEIYEKCTDRLAVNCFIIKPKDINEFSMVCRDTYLLIPKLYIYERKTFDSAYTNAEIIREDFLTDDDVVQYRTSLVLNGRGDNFVFEKFGYESLMAAIVYRGATGRIIGQTKTKLIVSVRQPYCRDVEIFYSWISLYRVIKLLPEHECYGEMSEQPIRNEWKSYSPRCGDHQRSYFTGIGPMWYPYNDCDSYARYNFNTSTQFDIRIMDPFWDGAADPPHGRDDMRMLGPADHFGEAGESHSSLWACLCDFTYYNKDKIRANMFTGSAYYRGGLDELAKRNCVRNDGSLPRFGNVYRDFLRSYRSMDNVDYYYWNGRQYFRRRKWVPMYEFYAPSFSELLSNYPYLLYSYSDYTDDNSTFIHPFGCLMADGMVESVNVGEKIDIDDGGSANRYRPEEIFRSHYTLAGIYYPRPKNPQQYLVGMNLVDIMPWYTYKNYPGPGGGDGGVNSIQWAWQEYWKEVERQKITEVSVRYFSTILMGNHPTTDRLPITLTLAPYTGEDGPVSGRHAFLDVGYPNYKYDGMLKEHRLVCDEGAHIITVTPPTSSGDKLGNYGANPIWHVQLNDGPKRCFNMDGEWLTTSGEGCNVDLYKTCTSSPWLPDITLFDTGYYSDVPDSNRTITYYDTKPPTYEYYQRGLNVSVKPGSLGFLPRRIHQLGPEVYEMRVSKVSTCDEGGGSAWASVESINQFYPGSMSFNVVYCSESNELSITFKFQYPVSLGAVGINFKFGARRNRSAVTPYGNYKVKGTLFDGTLYHIPGIKLYKSDDDSIYTSAYNLDSMKLATKTDTIKYINGFYEFSKTTESVKPTKYLKITFRLVSSAAEVDGVGGDYKKYFFKAINKVAINYIYIYYNEFLEASENITTHERLYNISYGGHGDFPPHGYENTGSLLYVIPNDKSTVYQMDSIGGVVGMPGSAGDCKSMNKVRGRILKKCHSDKERLESSELAEWEMEQKKIHDEVAIKSGSTIIVLRSFPPPNMQYLFKKANVNFPSWNCNLINTLVAPLLPVYAAAPYSPCGHNFIRDMKAVRYSMCAMWGRIYGRTYQDNWDVGFKFYCGGDEEMVWHVDVLKNASSLHVLNNAFNARYKEWDRADEVNKRLRAAAINRNPSKYSYPSPVDPIY